MTKREMLLQAVADRAFIVALSSRLLQSEPLADLSQALQALYLFDMGKDLSAHRQADEAHRLGIYLHDGGVYCGND